MLTATKFVAACLRLVAFGSLLYLVFTVISSFLMMGRLPGGVYGLFVLWGIAAALLFIYSIPLARVIADDIDQA